MLIANSKIELGGKVWFPGQEIGGIGDAAAEGLLRTGVAVRRESAGPATGINREMPSGGRSVSAPTGGNDADGSAADAAVFLSENKAKKMKVEELKEMARSMGIRCGKNETKRSLAGKINKKAAEGAGALI